MPVYLVSPSQQPSRAPTRNGVEQPYPAAVTVPLLSVHLPNNSKKKEKKHAPGPCPRAPRPRRSYFAAGTAPTAPPRACTMRTPALGLSCRIGGEQHHWRADRCHITSQVGRVQFERACRTSAVEHFATGYDWVEGVRAMGTAPEIQVGVAPLVYSGTPTTLER